MRADGCRFTHPQPLVPQGVPGVVLRTIARVGAWCSSRSDRHEGLLRDVVEAA